VDWGQRCWRLSLRGLPGMARPRDRPVRSPTAAYAIDVVAGSGLTKLSLLGPNPIFGVRFYGIGNESRP